MLDQLLQNCDLLQLPIELRIENNKAYKSIMGGIFTILTIIISVIATIYFGWSIIYNTNFTVNLSRIREEQAVLNLTNNFPLMLGLVKRGSDPIDNLQQYANFSLLTYDVEVINTTSIKKLVYLNASICQKEDFDLMEDSFLSISNPRNATYFTCLKQNQAINIYGTIGTSNSSYLAILVNKCVNTTEIICKSNEEIDYLFRNVYLRLFLKDSYFANNNYNNPAQFYANHFTIPISNTAYKRSYIYLKNIDYISDYGLIFENKQIKTTYQIDSGTADLYFNSDAAFTNVTISEVSITISNIKDVYTRSYYKLQNLAADLGGILKVITVVFMFFNRLILNPVLDNKIFNSLFTYPKTQHQQRETITPKQINNNNNNNKLLKTKYYTKVKNDNKCDHSKDAIENNSRLISILNNCNKNSETDNACKTINNQRNNLKTTTITILNSNDNINNHKLRLSNSKNKLQEIKVTNIKTNNNINNINNTNSDKNAEILISYFNSKNRVYWNTIFFCCITNHKRNKYNFVEQIINNLMDVRTILKTNNSNNNLSILRELTSNKVNTNNLLSEYNKYLRKLPIINTDILTIDFDNSKHNINNNNNMLLFAYNKYLETELLKYKA